MSQSLPENLAIRVENVSKKFARSLKKAMLYGLVDIAKAGLIPHRYRSDGFHSRLNDAVREKRAGEQPALAPNPQIDRNGLRPSEFWALRDVSFEVKKGECVGLIGGNGAGKSTLFSIMSGIIGPTHGRVWMRGRVQALIALGAGFHPLLTGRENVYLNASILGLTGREIDERLDKIIEFAEIGPFIDAPVKMYSSGMLVRLGFAVAAHMDPDILLVDEVLAVGDAAFQQKCQNFSRTLINSGKSIMIVAHNLLVIQALTKHSLWLHEGQVQAYGDTQSVVATYKEFVQKRWRSSRAESCVAEDRLAIIRKVIMIQEGFRVNGKLRANLPWQIHIEIAARKPISCARLWVVLGLADDNKPIMGASMYNDGHFVSLDAGTNIIILKFKNLPLQESYRYILTLGIRDYMCYHMYADSYASDELEIVDGPPPCLNGIGDARIVEPRHAIVSVPYEWEVAGGCVLHRSDIYKI